MQRQQAESSTGFLSIFTFSLSLQSAEENYFRLHLSSSTDVRRVFHLLLIVFISRPSFENVLSSGCVGAFLFYFTLFYFFGLLWVDFKRLFLFIYLSLALLEENLLVFSSLVFRLPRRTWIENRFVPSYVNQHLFSLFINRFGIFGLERSFGSHKFLQLW